MTSPNRPTLSAACLAALAALGLAASGLAAQTCDTNGIFPSPWLVPGSPALLSASADLDGDGDLDIVAVLIGGNQIRVFINDGVGGFTEQDSGATQLTSIQTLDLADLDGDGIEDAIVVSRVSGTQVANWYKGKGDGTFEPSPEIVTNTFTRRLLAIDLDGDGDLDLVTTGLDTDPIRFYLNDGSGEFGAPTVYPYIFPTNSAFSNNTIAGADLNGDGVPDLVFSLFGRFEEFVVVMSSGVGQYLPPRFYSSDPDFTSVSQGVVLEDFNGDGHIDIAYDQGVSPNSSVPSGLWVRFNDGAGVFSEPTIFPGLIEGIIAADFDGDGDIDIAARERVLTGPEFSRFTLFRNDGNGDFSDKSNPLPLFPGSSDTLRLTDVGDFDGNGALDLVFPTRTTGQSGLLIAYNLCVHPPVIGQQPAAALVNAGEDAGFSITLTSGATPLTYQWRRNGVDLIDSGGISGANTPVLALSSVAASDEGFYDCVVTNPQGTRTSSRALLAVADTGPGCSNRIFCDGFESDACL